MRFLFNLNLFLYFLIINLSFLKAHEGHHPISSDPIFLASPLLESNYMLMILNQIGQFHLVLLHFPIALIMMTVVAECLWMYFKKPLYNYAAQFMIVAAAISVIPTVLLGLAYGYGQLYEGISLQFYDWHRYFGFLTAGLAMITAFLRTSSIASSKFYSIAYLASLFLLFVSVSLTATFGGRLAFGFSI